MPQPPTPGPRLTMLHVAPGRLRLKVPGLYRRPALKRQLEKRLQAQALVYRVEANPVTGNLLVLHAPTASSDHCTKLVEAALMEARTDPTAEASWSSTHSSATEGTPWHRLSHEAVLDRLGSSFTGAGDDDAKERLRRFGPNRLPRPPRRTELEMLAGQLASAPVALLGLSAVLSLMTGGVVDAVVIGVVVAVNGAAGFLTERRAERTIEGLERFPERRVMVIRGGRRRNVPVEHLIPGDLMLLAPDAYVPADGRLLESARLSVDQSALTGESMPVTKDPRVAVPERAPLAERSNMVYMGTLVTGGSGKAVVTATGPGTEIGAIQSLAGGVTRVPTPLERQLERTGNQLLVVTVGLAAAVFGLGLLRGFGAPQMVKTAISLAVAAVPEGLPAVATTTLAMRVRDMGRRGVLVRRFDAVESLGAVQVFCLDKTGTLTENRMTVTAVYADSTRIHVDDRGFLCKGRVIDPVEVETLVHLLQIVSLCSEVEVVDGRTIAGSPTEQALLALARGGGIDVADLRRRYPRQAVDYRAEQQAYMRTVHAAKPGSHLYAIKGNPAEVLALCSHVMFDGRVLPLDEERRREILAENDRMAGEALRVLGIAYAYTFDARPPSGLTWLGLTGMADPLRRGMADLMARFHRAGIETVMITGDQTATAYAIAKQLDLSRGQGLEILDSTDLEGIDPELLAGLVRHTHVFARVSPANKLQIVQALQRNGKVVAMTGDGINDGPALKAADIGVALGAENEVARSVADVVLREPNLDAMITAVRQGRTAYANVRKAIHYLLATNMSEVEVMLAGVILGKGPPLSPIQLLWINLISDIFPALALTQEPDEPDVLSRPPRDPSVPLIDRPSFARMGRQSTLISAGAMGAYAYGLLRHGPSAANSHAFMALTLGQIIHALSARSDRYSVFHRDGLPPNRYLSAAVAGSLALQVSTALAPPLRRLLGVGPLGLVDALVIGAGAAVPFLINEAVKPLAPAEEGQAP